MSPHGGSCLTEEQLLSYYEEVCRSHSAITDFRAKLLALLPIASGTGIGLLLTQADGEGDIPTLLLVVDGVDVHEPMTFAYTEAEFLLEQVSTVRSRLKGRLRRRTSARGCARSLGSRTLLSDPVTFIGRWTALSLVRLGLEPVFDEELGHAKTFSP